MKAKFLLLLLLHGAVAFAQTGKRHTLSGVIKDARNGEELIGATIYIDKLKTGTTTNQYGFYAITVPPGTYSVSYNYVGYSAEVVEVDLNNEDKKVNLELKENTKDLKEVVISGDRPDAKNVEQNKMSVIKVDIREVKKIPLLLGEVDIIKAVQLLPGAQAAGDGSSNMTVRGGNIDHNLVMLDEAVVYNPSHVLGFFSAFNGDAIKEFELYKGGIPGQFGGRLASVLDVRMRDGNSKDYNFSGGIGTLSSRFTAEGPIVKDKSSFMISGRRSYFDLFFPLVEELDNTTMYFYDVNMKLNYTLSDKDKVFLSAYLGEDKLSLGGLLGFGWGNKTISGRWNHLFSNKLFVNTTAIYSRYDYILDINIAKNLNFRRTNYINDYTFKADGTFYMSQKSTIKFGTKLTYYVFEPGSLTPITSESIILEDHLPRKRAFEQNYYASHSLKLGARHTVEYGARVSVFSNIGSGRSINYIGSPTRVNDNGYIIEGIKDTNNLYTNYGSGEIYHTYIGIEPRMNYTFLLNSSSSLKASYNRMYQYMHLIQNITASTGQEFWTPSDQYIKPQQADQFAIGYFRNFKNNTIEASVEGYYKIMKNTIELRDGADVQFNEAIEAQIVPGEGRAYGLEFLIRKQRGKTTGWLGYTLLKTERRADNINGGNWYPFRFDRTNYLTIVVNHEFNKRWSAGASFIYATGEAFTTVSTKGPGLFGDATYTNVYGARNASRYQPYHRLDLSVTLIQKKKTVRPLWIFKQRPFEGSWVFSLYNAYGRANAYTYEFSSKNIATPPASYNVPVIYKWYLFTYVPAVTYNFKF